MTPNRQSSDIAMQAKVVFAIPIAPKTSEEQWNRVNDLLAQTLNSLRNQTDSRFLAYVCGHEKPPCLEGDSQQFLFVQADHPRPDEDSARRSDKTTKRWKIATIVRQLDFATYYMYLDGDDLIHKDLVSYVLNHNNHRGYIIDKGFAWDYTADLIAPIPGAFRHDYHHVCGSSGIVYFSPDDLPATMARAEKHSERLFFKVRNHLSFDKFPDFAEYGLDRLPFAAGVYTLNHSVNLSYKLVRDLERQQGIARSIAERALEDDRHIRDVFGILTNVGVRA